MFVTQVGVSESRYVTVQRLETINAVTGKEFPVSGDAPLRMQQRLLKAQMNAAYGKAMLDIDAHPHYLDTDSVRTEPTC